MPKLMKKAIRFRRADGRTDPNYRKPSLLKTYLEAINNIFVEFCRLNDLNLENVLSLRISFP